jgi:anaerobic selenocysteine-containing dehydrogenase
LCGGVRAIQAEHGPAAVAFLGTGQMPTEELAFLGALCKIGFGMLHGDANTRQCMATSAVAYKQSFGFDAPPFTYADFEASDTLIFVGANPCIAHPILWERVMRNRQQPTIVVIDPRRTETAMQATHHLAIAPKGDLALLYAVANVLIERDWIDRAVHRRPYERVRCVRWRLVACVHAGACSQRMCGLTPAQIEDFAATIHRGKAVSFWWTMGVNQSYQGVRTAQAIINLCLMTGNIGTAGNGSEFDHGSMQRDGLTALQSYDGPARRA